MDKCHLLFFILSLIARIQITLLYTSKAVEGVCVKKVRNNVVIVGCKFGQAFDFSILCTVSTIGRSSQ